MEPQTEGTEGLVRAVRNGRILGLVLCLAWPLVLMAMIGGGAVRAGNLPPVGPLRILGYVFMALTLMAGAFVTWRTNRVMGRFQALPPQVQARTAFRETLLDATLFELSCLYGLIYWMLVGRNAFQHVLLFMALTPIMYFLFVPGLNDWMSASEGTRE